MSEDYDVDATMRLMRAELAALKARAEAAEKELAAEKASTKRLRSDMQSCIDRQGGMLIDAAKEIARLRGLKEKQP